MPTIALGYYVAPAFMRLIRAGMVEVLSADYIRTARAKGLRARTVLFKHALRNAIVPVVALAAVQLGFLLGGSVVIETIFALDGLGYLAYESISHKDFPVMQAVRDAALGDLRPADARGRHGQRLARSAHPGGIMVDAALQIAEIAATDRRRARSRPGLRPDESCDRGGDPFGDLRDRRSRAGCSRRTIPTPRT